MKYIVAIVMFFNINSGYSQKKQIITLANKVVEASCGQCNFGMKGSGCTLAVKVDGKPYFVDNSSIDDHGNAHAEDGFCMKIRHAKVSGKVIENKFVAESFTLLPLKAKSKTSKK